MLEESRLGQSLDVREHDTKFSFIWGMFKLRHWILDIDGFSWSNESLCNFFRDILNETDDYSKAIGKEIFSQYWHYTTSDAFHNIQYSTRPDWLSRENLPEKHKGNEYHLNIVKHFINLLYASGDINFDGL